VAILQSLEIVALSYRRLPWKTPTCYCHYVKYEIPMSKYHTGVSPERKGSPVKMRTNSINRINRKCGGYFAITRDYHY
jgi:hypothetical protein